jgi:uncharacterized protein
VYGELSVLTAFIALMATGLVAGTLSGMIGIGGATIIIPVLVFLGFDQKMAQGTTLFVMLPPISLLAVMQYYKAGHINMKIATIVAVFFFLGAFFGGKLAIHLHEDVLRKTFAVFMFVVSLKMFFS